MAAIFDAASSTQGTAVTSLTFSHTVASQSNLCIVIDGHHSDGSPGTTSSMTYNAVAVTAININVTAQTFYHLSTGYLIAPATGANNVVVNYSINADEACAGAVSYYDVDQTTPVGTAANANGNSTSASVNVTTVSGDTVHATTYCGQTTLSTTQTQRWEQENISAQTSGNGIEATASGTSTTMTTALPATDSWIIGGFALKGVVAGLFPPFRNRILRI